MLSILALLAAPLVAACATGCSGNEIGARNPGMPFNAPHFAARQAATGGTDATAECAPYNYPDVSGAASQFPGNWQRAKLVAGDDEAAALFKTLNDTLNQKYPGVGATVAGQANTADDALCWWTKSRCTTPKDTSVPADVTILPEPETWGLGFDDGPNCSHNALYDFLKQNNQKATMFYIGSNVMNWPKQAKRGHDDGHQICVHTWSHPQMTQTTNEEAFAELYYARKMIKLVTGYTPKCWRPAQGDVDNRIRTIAAYLNLTNVLWSDDTFDWQIGTGNVTAETVKGNYQKIIQQAQSGMYKDHGPIVLNHEVNNYTMQEFVEQYPAIKGAFKYLVPIASAFNETHPYAEADLSYPDFASYTSGQTTGSSTGGSASGSSTTDSGKATGTGGSATTGTGSGTTGTTTTKASGASPRATAGVLVLAGFAVALLF